jgi:hypothetical protein
MFNKKMKVYTLIESNIEYTAVECIGPLEYVDAKCIMYDIKDKCIIFQIENENYHNGGPINLKVKRKEYYFKSKLHNDHGPATITIVNSNRDVRVEYYLYGIKYSSEKYNIRLRKEKIIKLNSKTIF